MENIALSLVIGISSSLFATALFISLSEFVRKCALPWYADKIYRGVRIDGDWEVKEILGNDLNSNNQSVLLSLKQKGDKISGFYIHKDKEDISEYVLEGKIRDMYFLATSVPKSNRHADAATLLLYIKNADSKLVMDGGLMYQGSPGEVDSNLGVRFEWKNS